MLVIFAGLAEVDINLKLSCLEVGYHQPQHRAYGKTPNDGIPTFFSLAKCPFKDTKRVRQVNKTKFWIQ